MTHDRAGADSDMERDDEIVRKLLAEVGPLLPESKRSDYCAVLEYAVEQAPTDLSRYHALAGVYLQSEKPDLARQTLHRALAAGANDDWTYRLLGSVHAREDNLAAAIEAGREALRRAPHKREVLRELYAWQSRTDQWEEAWDTLTRLVEAAPDWAATLTAQAVYAAHTVNWPEAERYARCSLRADPKCGATWLNLALALYNQGRRGEALRCCLRGRLYGEPRLANEYLCWAMLGVPVVPLGANLLLTAGFTWLVWRLAPESSRAGAALLVGGAAAALGLVGFFLSGRSVSDPDRPLPFLARLTALTGTYTAFFLLQIIYLIVGGLVRRGWFGSIFIGVLLLSVAIGGVPLFFNCVLVCVFGMLLIDGLRKLWKRLTHAD